MTYVRIGTFLMMIVLLVGSFSSTMAESHFTNSYSPNWPTYHKDLTRDGFDNYSRGHWPPKLAWRDSNLDGSIYAEPLVYNGALIVATENDSIYALNDTTGSVIWRTNLGTPVPGSILPCGDINPSGITGTPAIDETDLVVYAVAYLYHGPSNPPEHVLFGLSLDSGNVVFKRHVNPPGVDPKVEQQRGALAVSNGVVYIPYGGLAGDCGLYHGFVIGVPTNGSSTLHYQVPTGRRGGIWAPSGESVDGNIFVATGNSASTTKFDFGDAVIQLSPSLNELNYFAPRNWAFLNSHDLDVGSVGPAILGTSGLIFQIGKQGVGYLLNESNLGGIGGQIFSKKVCPSGGAFGGTAFTNDVIYVPCVTNVFALEVDFSSQTFSILWTSKPSFHAGPPIFSGGLVWSVDTNTGNLYALGPNNGTSVFKYNVGQVAHFTSPTSSDGYVFVAADNTISAFLI